MIGWTRPKRLKGEHKMKLAELNPEERPDHSVARRAVCISCLSGYEGEIVQTISG
jgi:hypothetical protein